MHLSIGSLEDRQRKEQYHKYFSPERPNWEKTQQPSSKDENYEDNVQWTRKRKYAKIPSKYRNP